MDTQQLKELVRRAVSTKDQIKALEDQAKEKKEYLRQCEEALLRGLIESDLTSVKVAVEIDGVEVKKNVGIRRELWAQLQVDTQTAVAKLIELGETGLLAFAHQSARSWISELEEAAASEGGKQRYNIAEIRKSLEGSGGGNWGQTVNADGESGSGLQRILTPDWIPEHLRGILAAKEKLAVSFRSA